jgi:IS30 family transposase
MRVWSQQEQSENRVEFWRLLKSDTSIATACEVLGVSRRTGRRWILETGGRPPLARPALSGRYLSIDERIRIADLALAGSSVRKIAAEIGRCPSTVSRELRRNGPGAGRRYGPHAAQKKAETRARRPRALKLDYAELADVVQAKLCKKWSPEQISLHLDAEYPNRCEMRVAHETIYQALFRQAPSVAGLHVHLRTGRPVRRPRGRASARAPRIVDMTLIADRPASVQSRLIPGHWEGDLILGTNCRSAIATLVERHSRYLVLVGLPDGHRAQPVRDALIDAFSALPDHLRQTLTWDQGTELARHKEIALATELTIYFCDPHSPWQRGSNENTNGLVRQYFPKGTDLSIHNHHRLAEVADELNNRPRKILNMNTPAELMLTLLSPTSATTVRNERVATTT